MKRWCVLPWLLLVIPLLYGQNRAITHDDLFHIKRVSDPQVSPDGLWIAYVVTEYDKPANSSNSDIWLISIEGGEPRRLTEDPESDLHPRWSPDGQTLAFTSDRTGTEQVFLLTVATGEIRQLTTLSTGAADAVWSRDGEQLAFISEVFPELEGDEANAARLKAIEESEVEARVTDRLLYRHWDRWTDRTRSHVFVQSVSGGAARDMTPGDYDTPPISLGGDQDYTFSPDGSWLCYVKNIDPTVAVSTNNDLFLVNLSTGATNRLTENPANDNSPQYSPDGRFLAYRAQERAGFESDRYDLMVLDLDTKAVTNLTGHADISVREYIWAPGGQGIYFDAAFEGQRTVFQVALDSREVRQLTGWGYYSSLQLSPSGETIVFLHQKMANPPEIYKWNMAQDEEMQITHTNDDLLSQLEMNESEEFWFKGAGGTSMHGLLLKPPGFSPERQYPLLFLVHGGPQGAWSNMFHFRWNAQLFASPGYVVVMINPRGSTGYGQKLTDEISGDWGGKVYQDLMKGLDYILETYDYIDPDRLAAAGGSYGGYMMNWFAGHTDRFKALVCHAGVFNLTSMYLHTEELWFPEWEFEGTPWTNPRMYRKWSPHMFISKFKTPMLVIHGEQDFRVPVSEGLQTFTALQKMGVPSKLLYFPDEGHFVLKPLNSELWYETIHDWLAVYLK
ncbi:MAG: S9 family peptidase [Fidelibacterota bacterium]|nr:MAG: S9 family peptidase [Candidatus Neomarinimicrobiota bacterium]